MTMDASQTQTFLKQALLLIHIFEDQFNCCRQTNKQLDKFEACATCMVTLTQLFELFNDSHNKHILQSHIDNDAFVIDTIRKLHDISKLFVPKFIQVSHDIEQHEPDIVDITRHMKLQADLFSIHFHSI